MKHLLLLISLLFIGVQVKAQSFDHLTSSFNTGHYYKSDGTRVNGEIKIICAAKFGTLPHNSFYFKAGDGNQEKYTTKDVIAFVIGTDSFIVVKNIEHGEAKLPEDFVHVDGVEGDITTVTHYTTTGNEGEKVGLTLYVKKGIAYTSLKAAQKAK